jgi:plastocyanin
MRQRPNLAHALATPIMRVLPLGLIAALGLGAAATAMGADPATITVTLQNHQFTPAAFTVPAGQKVRINLVNRDAATEEFDSHDLRVEEVVTPMGRISFTIGPLQPGQYSFMGEFHAATAQGKVTAVAGGH